MSHQLINGNVIVDWTTGDPEGDRAYLFQAYRNFLKELKALDNIEVNDIFSKWKVEFLELDDFPRINIEYPENFSAELKETKLHNQSRY